MPYKPTYLPDGRKAYNPRRTERDIWDEWEAIEQQLRTDHPNWEHWRISLEARELWRQEEAKAEPWRDWQQRVWYPRMRALQSAKPDTELTRDEWAYLAEQFSGANHPLAMSIQAKAARR